jgi:hypothetical protein
VHALKRRRRLRRLRGDRERQGPRSPSSSTSRYLLAAGARGLSRAAARARGIYDGENGMGRGAPPLSLCGGGGSCRRKAAGSGVVGHESRTRNRTLSDPLATAPLPARSRAVPSRQRGRESGPLDLSSSPAYGRARLACSISAAATALCRLLRDSRGFDGPRHRCRAWRGRRLPFQGVAGDPGRRGHGPRGLPRTTPSTT